MVEPRFFTSGSVPLLHLTEYKLSQASFFICLEKHDLWQVIKVTSGTLYNNKDNEKSCLRDLSSVCRCQLGERCCCGAGATLAATLQLLRHRWCAKKSDHFKFAFGFVGCSHVGKIERSNVTKIVRLLD